MPLRLSTIAAGTVYLLTSQLAGASAPTPHFTGLGDFPGGVTQSRAFAVSDDGSTVVGVGTTADGWQPFRWTLSEGLVPLGPASPPIASGQPQAGAYGVSDDGSFIVGDVTLGGVSNAWRWTAANGYEVLNGLSGDTTLSTRAADCAGDGTRIFGSGDAGAGPAARFRPLQWTDAPTPTLLSPEWSDALSASAIGCNDDGSVVVGQDLLGGPFRWRAASGIERLELAGFDTVKSSAVHVSGDGDVVVGNVFDEDTGDGVQRAAMWDATGSLQLLPPGKDGLAPASARSVSDDGTVIVGVGQDVGFSRAFIWDETHGTRRLQSVLVDDYGLDLSGWTLEVARDVAADNHTIVGYGINPDGRREAFVARLPEPGTLAAFALLIGLLRRR